LEMQVKILQKETTIVQTPQEVAEDVCDMSVSEDEEVNKWKVFLVKKNE